MTAMTFRKKPIEIEAMQFVAPDAAIEGDEGNRKEIVEWGAPIRRTDGWAIGEHALFLDVAKGGSVCTVNPGDWIIKEPSGDGFYPCTADDFDATYAPDGEPSPEIIDPKKEQLRVDVERLTDQLADADEEIDRLKAEIVTRDERIAAFEALFEEAAAHPVETVVENAAADSKKTAGQSRKS